MRIFCFIRDMKGLRFRGVRIIPEDLRHGLRQSEAMLLARLVLLRLKAPFAEEAP
jgi:hypothetical protein